MQSHRHGSAPDFGRMQQGYSLQPAGHASRGHARPRSDSSGAVFGVRIQVQGVEGRPYVVMNNGDSRAPLPSGGLETYSRNWDHQEVSVISHSQSEYTIASVGSERSPMGSPYAERRPPNHQGEYALGGSLSEVRESQRTPLPSSTSTFDFSDSALQQLQRSPSPSNTALNYQRHPELLKPYDPERNSLGPLLSTTQRVSAPSAQVASVPRTGHLTRVLQSVDGATQAPACGSKPARIPLPAEGLERAQSPGPVSAPTPRHPSLAALLSPPKEVTNVSRRSPNSVDAEPISSVGNLISQFNSPQQTGRSGPRRGRIAREDRTRSRSMDSTRRWTSEPLDPSSPASPILGTGEETSAGVAGVPGSPKAQGPNGASALNGASTLVLNKLRWEEQEPDSTSPRMPKGRYRVEKTSLYRTRSRSLNHANVESERETLVITPDILKGQRGQQQISAEPQQPNEDTTKQILFAYLKEGTTDNTSTTEKKLNLVFERINKLKWKTAENVEEECRDLAAEAKELQNRGVELEREVSQLKKQLEHKTTSARSLAEACEKAQTDSKTLQDELHQRQDELSTLRNRLTQMETELEVAREELIQVKAEREQGRNEMKDLQEQLSEMHDELDRAKNTTEEESMEKQVLRKDLVQLRSEFQELLQLQEEQDEVLHWKERELTALKGALKEEVESHDKELGIMKEVHNQEVQLLREKVEEVTESNTALGEEKREVEEDRGEAQGQLKELMQQREDLMGQVDDLEGKVEQLNFVVKESKTLQRQLVKCIEQLKKDKQQVEETLAEVRKKEDEMCQANKDLLTRLENVQSELTKLNHDHREVKERLKEESHRAEELNRIKNDLEEEKRLQDSTVDKLQKEMSDIVGECEASTERLQQQVDGVREKSNAELAELRLQLQEKGAELEKSRQVAKRLQEELFLLEHSLDQCRRESEEAQQSSRLLERRVEELEERNIHAQEDHARQLKLMEGQITQLEQDLTEERNSADLLMDRMDKGKQQIEQIRGELLQERAVRQDLECDKISLERQNKDLKSRVSHLEGSQRSNQDVVVSRLEGRIQELEGRLQGEERDNINLQQANRKLERKVKEMMMRVDDEHLAMQSERDQLNQRLKTAKRQMDEAEEEIERLEHSKKKLQRDLDEQIETNDEILVQLNALRAEMRRKQQKSAPLLKDDNAVYVNDINSD
ncbi:cingulin-like protein 1 [Esox lucius]|uniref:Myosin tail domain-containing protein n=1 Tax=Esox lucius TaxID=8010 RepID=A0A3P8XJ88_ESOLU|nr:cingulin-like protein 1 [Esox lucius]